MATVEQTVSSVSRPFRPTARLLQLLGDELIASPRLAVFELVKNAYDADASKVTVGIHLNPTHSPFITVTDNGVGMTPEILEHVWLVPGSDHRQKQRSDKRRTPLHNRLPIGEKGVGRFAAHKLGDRIRVITRARNNPECLVEINWEELTRKQFLEEALVTITQRHPDTFTEDSSGTCISISGLRSKWTRGEVRHLFNQITSISSPFEAFDGFQVVFELPGYNSWLDGLPDVKEILEKAFWKFEFQLKDAAIDWEYTFRQVPGLNIQSRTLKQVGERLKLPRGRADNPEENTPVATQENLKGIGAIRGVFYVYDRDRNILRHLPAQQATIKYLDEAGGIRVYRDGIRVYNYGEEGDDWLGLDLRRVNVPTRRISRNIILGAVHLSLEESSGLVEKTNREGFQDSEIYRNFRRAVLGILEVLEAERHKDKEDLRKLTSRQPDLTATGLDRLLNEVKHELKRLNINSPTIDSCLRRISRHYHDMENTLLSAGLSGMNLAMVFHEIEHGVRNLHLAVRKKAHVETLETLIRNLTEILDGFTALLRRSSQDRHSARDLIRSACQISHLRLDYHGIDLTCPILETDGAGFYARFPFNLALGSLSNLIDNAIYWLRVQHPEQERDAAKSRRKLYIGVSRNFDAGPAIVVADNGTGFSYDTPEQLVRPFFTRKPDGMGLGLYYAHLVMEAQQGQLAFPQPGEVELPEGYNGAVAAMIFKEDAECSA